MIRFAFAGIANRTLPCTTLFQRTVYHKCTAGLMLSATGMQAPISITMNEGKPAVIGTHTDRHHTQSPKCTSDSHTETAQEILYRIAYGDPDDSDESHVYYSFPCAGHVVWYRFDKDSMKWCMSVNRNGLWTSVAMHTVAAYAKQQRMIHTLYQRHGEDTDAAEPVPDYVLIADVLYANEVANAPLDMAVN